MVRVGVVGCNYGASVLVPAFRKAGAEVVALAGTSAARTDARAEALNIPSAFYDWRKMLRYVDAVALAVPPKVQPVIALEALAQGKAVFANKPLAADLQTAEEVYKASYQKVTMVDFGFPEIPAFVRARELLRQGAIGNLRSIQVTWNVESRAIEHRTATWKLRTEDGGGALNNFVSHVLYYLEWLHEPIASVSAQLTTLPDDLSIESGVTAALTFQSGASGSIVMSSASYLGSGHRIEIYGEKGTLVLNNPTRDTMRGFVLSCANRPNEQLWVVEANEGFFPLISNEDGRISTAASLASRFLAGIEAKDYIFPCFADGYRVQYLIDACRRSDMQGGVLISTLDES